MPFAPGIWDCGSSITKGAGSPEKALIFFIMIHEIITKAIPEKYIKGATHHAPPIRYPAMVAITGSFAPHGIDVVVIMVILLSFSFSIVRVAIMPGTAQPDEIKKGIKLSPESPNLRKIRSMINATRAMYPQSSRMDKKKNTIAI